MFVRPHHVRRGDRDYTYLKVVENVRVGKRSVQKTLINLGNVTQWPAGKLEQAVGLLNEFLGMEGIDLSQVEFCDCRTLGPYLPLDHLWSEIGLDEMIEGALSDRRIELPVAAYARAMAFNRLVDPRSKRSVHETMLRDVQVPGIDARKLPLHGYYRALEHLSQIKTQLERSVHARLSDLFSRDLSLVFYDLTSTCFEGKGCSQARHGYSRDHRPDLVQIEIGLLVDAEGIPIGHEVFDGNVKDVKTVIGALERLNKDFEVRRCVFVNDDGMASAENLEAIKAAGYEFITSMSLRHSETATRLIEKMPPRSAFERIKDNMLVAPLGQEGDRRYIASYNPKRAEASRVNRYHAVRACATYLRQLQQPPKTRGRRPRQTPQARALEYVRHKHIADLFNIAGTPDGALNWSINRDAWRRERRMDGLMLLQTNSTTLRDEEVVLGYRSLWRVENAFRDMKDLVRLRPIRHWSDPRVLGHVLICVLAYTLERLLDLTIQRHGLEQSARSALEALHPITVATLTVGDKKVRRRSRITPEQSAILQAAGVNHVQDLW